LSNAKFYIPSSASLGVGGEIPFGQILNVSNDVRFCQVKLVTCTPFSGVCVAHVFYGEFDPGSGRTLAACLTHASRTLKHQLAGVDEWRTGE
jgi:hypothetical protein